MHEGPTPEKLTALKEFLAASALSLGGGDNPTPGLRKLLAKIKGRPDFNLLQTVLLRSLQQAVYSPDNEGHFGLGYDAYTHFTSPIRRYPDLLVHRAIKACLAGTRYQPGGTGWAELGVHCSLTERRADDATRDVENWLKCYFMQDRVGEVFDGTISGVTHFGLFVTLDGLNVDGLVHVTELGNDYFHFDAVHHAMNGERSGKSYRLADRIPVKVARVDLETTKIDFVLADASGAPCRGTKPRQRRRARARAADASGCALPLMASAIGLRRHAQVRPQRLVALRKFLLDELGILQRRHDDDVLAVLPVARRRDPVVLGELQRIDHPQHLVEVAARRRGIGDDQAHDLLADRSRTASGPSAWRLAFGMNHVVERRDLAVGVGDDRKVDARVLRVVDVLDPALVRLDRIDRQRDDLDVALGEFVLQLGRSAQLGRAHRREVRGMREQDAPTVAEPLVETDGAFAGFLRRNRGPYRPDAVTW